MRIEDPLANQPLDWTTKGLSESLESTRTSDSVAPPLSLFSGDLYFPVAALKHSAVMHNSNWMREFTSASGISIAPHGKTTMAPDLFRLQLEDGAWAMTAATVNQVRVFRQFGVRRILLANQLVGTGSINWILGELMRYPDFELYSLVDSIDGVKALVDACDTTGFPGRLNLLIEVGLKGGRAGARSLNSGLELARAIAQSPTLKLVGIEAFEGVFQLDSNADEAVDSLLEFLIALAQSCDNKGYFEDEIILTAGGSSYFDRVAETFLSVTLSKEVRIVLRSGCYLTHDNGMYQQLFDGLLARSTTAKSIGTGLRPALQIWAYVQSIPESGRIICSMGKRDCGSDAGVPVPVLWARPGETGPKGIPVGHNVVSLNDHHAFIDAPPDGPLHVGDLVGFGISHPCTTFDRWRALLVIDDDWNVSKVIRTYF